MATYIVSIEGQSIPVPEEIGADDQKVRQALAPYFPDAANAMITRTTKGEVVTVNVVKKAGSKGLAEDPLMDLIACPGGKNPAIALYVELQSAEGQLDPVRLLALDERIERAIEQGEAQVEAMKMARKRLAAARPLPAPAVVVGF